MARRPVPRSLQLARARLIGRDSVKHALGVPAVNLVEHRVGKKNPVDVPEPLAVVARGTVEILVAGFEESDRKSVV